MELTGVLSFWHLTLRLEGSDVASDGARSYRCSAVRRPAGRWRRARSSRRG